MTYFHGAIIFAMFFSAAVCTQPRCTEGEEDDCAKCYDVLVSQVILNAKNHFNLQQAFFPADQENPVFLEVIYRYDINTTNGPIIEDWSNDTEVWFWTDSGYYLFQPLEVIQLTSLFFADYSLRSSKVELHLRQDCRNALDKHKLLFTQRLELYAKKQSIHAEIDDSYIPKAMSVDLLEDLYAKNKDIIHVTRLAFASQFITPVLLFVLLLATWIYYWEVSTTKTDSQRKQLYSGWSTTEQKELKRRSNVYTVERDSVDLTVHRFLIVSFAFCLYVIALDIAAMYNAINTVDTYTKEYYGPDTGILNFSLEFGIVFLIFTEDCIVLLGTCALLLVIVIKASCDVREVSTSQNQSETKLHHYWSLFVYAPLGPMMCVVIHSKQILIGFIHAPYHATSVLVFYGILFLAFFHSFMVFHNILRLIWQKVDEPDKKNNRYYFFLFLIYGLITVVSCGLIVFIVAFFVLVPIDNAIDDAPNQLLSIERTVVLVLAITVVYKLYSRNSHTILWYILKAKDEKGKKSGRSDDKKPWDYQWAQLEDEEKYVSIGTLLLDKLENQEKSTDDTEEQSIQSSNEEQSGDREQAVELTHLSSDKRDYGTIAETNPLLINQ